MSLSNTLKEIKKVSLLAKGEVSAEPIETLSNRRGRKNRAVEELKKLRQEYSEGLLQSAVFIVVTGSLATEFSEASTGPKLECFAANPEDFYRDLADRVPTTLIGKEGTGSLFDILGRHLEDKANELGIIGYPQLQFKKGYTAKVTNREEFVQLVKRAINEQVGAEIVAIQAVRSLADAAIDRSHDATLTPIVLATTDEKFASDVAKAISTTSSRVFLVSAGETNNVGAKISTDSATPASVKAVLKQIKLALK